MIAILVAANIERVAFLLGGDISQLDFLIDGGLCVDKGPFGTLVCLRTVILQRCSRSLLLSHSSSVLVVLIHLFNRFIAGSELE